MMIPVRIHVPAESPSMTRSHILVLVGALALGVGFGCRVQRDNPDHCFHAHGDATCLERFPDASLPYCAAESCSDAPYGCVAELPEPDCYSPCGDEALLGEGECEVADESESGSDSDTSGVPPDMPPESECELDSDCLDQGGTLFCIDGSCEPCSSMPDPNLACATRDPALPVCHEDECVVCWGEDQAVCSAQGQICLPDTTGCGPCTDHDQCPGGAACNILDGVCFPEDAVWHIDGDGGQDFTTIEDTISNIFPGEAATFILHELDGDAIYQDRVFVSSKSIAVLAAPDEQPRVEQEAINVPAVLVVDGLFYTRGMEFRGIEGMSVTEQSRAHVENSAFYVTEGPAIDVGLDSYLVMRNSMVRGGGIDLRVLVARDSGYYDVVNSTLYGLAGEVLSCATVPTKHSSVRNSLILSYSDAELSNCPPVWLNTRGNAFSAEIVGEWNNVVIGLAQPDWFVDGLFDLHLTDQIPLTVTTAATWEEGDPLTDFDGDPRPVGPDVTDWAGADVPSP